LPRSPPCADLHEILHEGSTSRRNQPRQILSQSDQGFSFCGGSNFWLSHKKEKSPLTHGLNYRSACDNLLYLCEKAYILLCAKGGKHLAYSFSDSLPCLTFVIVYTLQ